MAKDTPIAFFDVSWIAVRDATTEAIISVLDLSDPTPSTWRQGLNAVIGDFWDFDAPTNAFLSRVFVTPKIGGWRLAIGGWLGGAQKRGKKPGSDVAGYCAHLSREFEAAHAFTSQGRMDWYSWCLASSGSIIRQFIWDESVVVDEGAPPPAERRSREAAVKPNGWRPSEGVVTAIAAECSVDPLQLHSLQSVGTGCVAVTAWGRKHGIPTRSLDNDLA